MSLPRAVTALLDPGTHAGTVPETSDAPRLVQSHISWIVLAGPYAYKVKKPVTPGFLDYSTLEKRLDACCREVALNRRLCPDVYLGVLPLVERDDVVVLGTPRDVRDGATVVEYAVWMRRLPAERMLDALLARGEATPAMVEAVAERLARFHATTRTGPGVDEHGMWAAVRANTEQNVEQVAPYVGRALDEATWLAIRDASRAFLTDRADLFARRVADGRVRDGHGDVHAASICITDPVAIFDCIEFADRYRCGDVATEVAFLAMDLEFNGRPDLAAEYVASYIALSGDVELVDLLDFYACYRAAVRGKVEALKLDEPEFDAADRAAALARARRYFALARTYAERLG